MEYQPLTHANLESVYELFRRNESFYTIPMEYFERGTLKDKDFDPDLTLILKKPKDENPIAALIALIRKDNCCIKALVVDKPFQRQGIGREMLKEIMDRAKRKKEGVTSINYGACPPNYWQPGVDLRHTSLLFFLRKNRFKPEPLRQNLTVHLDNINVNPLSERNGYFFERVQAEDFQNAFNFVKGAFPFSSWAEEVLFTFEQKPPTTFVAKNMDGKIIGWASHCVEFPGAFGPTGVLLSLQGQGIGSELLKWCLWDIKENGLDTCTIMWVGGKTIKFYSKSIGAYMHPVFYPMSRKLRR